MPSRPSPAVLQVFIFKNGEFIGTDMFSEQAISVGRDPAVADLVLDSSQVSRKHAVLEHDGARVVIRDNGSTNGIYLNNQRIQQSELTRLDEVLLGDYSLKIKLVSRNQPAAGMPEATVAAQVASLGDDLAGKTQADPFPEDLIARTRADQVASKGSGGDISDWDDVSGHVDGPSRKNIEQRAEFRDRGEIMDKERFGAVLEGIGITAPDGRAQGGPLPPEKSNGKAKPKPLAKPKMPAKPKAPVAEEPRFVDDEGADLDTAFASTAPERDERFDEDDSSAADDDAGPVPTVAYDDDDDDDDDANYVPPFSLVAQLLQEDATIAEPRSKRGRAIEVLTLQGDTVTDVTLLSQGQSFWIGPEVGFMMRRRARDLPPRLRLLKYTGKGDCRVELHQQIDGTLKRGQERLKLDKVSDKGKRRGTRVMGLCDGEVLDVADGATRYHIRYVVPPVPIEDERTIADRVRPDGSVVKSFGASFGVHVLALLSVYLFVPPELVHSTLRKNDDFVEVTLDAAPQLEEPPAEEKPEEVKEEAPEPVAKSEAKPSRRKPRPGGQSAAPAGVLGLLSKRGSSQAPGPAAAVAAVSNLTAARVPGGAVGFRVSGLIGKLPSSSLSVGGGGGGLMTKGGATLLRGG
ncbi:MAG: hypothetical protein A2341_07915, partial [Deltaproteobacteria bacterium RIFOXYB12_FULL_58_9]